jgi:hypothetical protein
MIKFLAVLFKIIINVILLPFYLILYIFNFILKKIKAIQYQKRLKSYSLFEQELFRLSQAASNMQKNGLLKPDQNIHNIAILIITSKKDYEQYSSDNRRVMSFNNFITPRVKAKKPYIDNWEHVNSYFKFES